MRFQFPQFIEEKTKLVGPLNFMQFIYVGVGFILIYILYQILPFILWLFLTVIIAALVLMLSFLQLNGMPFSSYVARAFAFLIGKKKYVYKKNDSVIDNVMNTYDQQ